MKTAHTNIKYGPNKAQSFWVVCAVLFASTLIAFSIELNFFLTSVQTDGVVTKLTAGKSHVRVKFVVEGKTIEYQQNGLIRYDVGDKVRVLYNKEDPEEASTSAIGALWSWTIAFALLTAGFGFFTSMATRHPELIN